MNRELKMSITIQERRYEAGRLSAYVAAWIFNLLLSATLNSRTEAEPTETKDEVMPEEIQDVDKRANFVVSAMWIGVGSTLDEKVYNRIQSACLKACSRWDEPSSTFIPLLMNDGRFTGGVNSEPDPAVLNQLVTETLQFNLASFFQGGASSPKAEADSQSSMPSSASR